MFAAYFKANPNSNSYVKNNYFIKKKKLKFPVLIAAFYLSVHCKYCFSFASK